MCFQPPDPRQVASLMGVFGNNNDGSLRQFLVHIGLVLVPLLVLAAISVLLQHFT